MRLQQQLTMGLVLGLLVAVQNAYAMPDTAPSNQAQQGSQLKTEPVKLSLMGKVVEAMEAGGYTYICLEKDGKKTWLAVPQVEIAVGEELEFPMGNQMGDFTSKSLKRTFDNIIFTTGPINRKKDANADTLSKAHQDIGQSDQQGMVASKLNVEKASGSNAFKVEELYEKSADLDGKLVGVRGKVVKVSEKIMGWNWIHLQDGSGDLKLGTGNLVATSHGLPTVGDIVTVSGILHKDKDFGGGYKYRVIMEEVIISH